MQSLGSSGGDIINQLSQYSTVTSPVVALSSSVSENDVCRDRPCSNNASCVQSGVTFTCVCEPGYTGVLCETGEHSPGEKVGISSWEEMFFVFFFPCVLRETQPFGRWLRAKTFPVYVGKRVQVELKVDLICKQLLFPPCHTPKQWTAVRKFTRLRRVSTKTLAELSSLLIDLQWNLNPAQN